MLRRWLLKFIDHHCHLCSAVVEDSTALCPECLKSLPVFEPRRIFRPAEVEQYLDGLYSGWDYDPKIKILFEKIKFTHQKRILLDLCTLAALPELQADLVSYVPVSLFRFKERGFNQARIIARALAENCFSVRGILSKKHTGKQSLKDRKNRYGVIENPPFKLKRKVKVKGLSILLIDDILTTGATLASCARLLKEAGAKAVYAFTLTHSELLS